MQKFLSLAGVASRRESEKLIRQGKIKVNDKVITELGTKINAERDKIVFNRRIVKLPKGKTYILLNKPKGYLTSQKDNFGRRIIYDLLPANKFRQLKYAGRIDYDSEGLILLTDDGELINRLSHPKYNVPKTYEVLVRGFPNAKGLKKMRTGISLEEGTTLPCKVRVLDKVNNNCILEVELREGKKRQIKRMFEKIEHPVIHLKRTAISFLRCDGIKVGKYRELSKSEVGKLIREVGIGIAQ